MPVARTRGPRVAQLGFALALACSALACSGRAAPGSADPRAGDAAVVPSAGASGASPRSAAPPALDLLPMLRAGSLDAAGPVVDFGDAQQSAYLLPPLPLGDRTQQGDSWALVGARVRVRVPVDPTRPPTALRMRLRRVHARAVLALVDGVPIRQAAIPVQGAGARAVVLSMPVAPERFRREVVEVELRFLGVSRAAALAARALAPRTRARPRRPTRRAGRPAPAEPRPFDPHATRPRPGAPSADRAVAPSNAAIVAELDWLHLARDETPPLRAGDLVSDVRIDGLPRRSAALYAPGRVGTLAVLPAGAVLRAALGADGVRGPDAVPVRARVLVESDGTPSVEHTEVVESGAPWRELSLDLAALAGRVVRISFSAEPAREPPPETAELLPTAPPGARGRGPALEAALRPRPSQTRLAVGDPRIERAATLDRGEPSNAGPRPAGGPAPLHALLVVLRGARADRWLPAPAARFAPGALARVAREGIALRAVAPSMRAVSALASVITGLPADVHGLTEWTDTLADEAPTLATALRDAGVVTGGFSDDPWWVGSGLDRGYSVVSGCALEGSGSGSPSAAGSGACRAEGVLARAANFLVEHAGHRAFALVVTRAGTPPFDPPPDVLATLDPTPPTNGITPEQTGLLALRSHRGPLALEPSSADRVAMLYDAAVLGADRGLGLALERLREAGTLERTVVIVVGDRGTALGEGGLVGEGPYTLAPVSHTLLALRGPGLRPPRVEGGAAQGGSVEPVAGVLDAAATLIERFGLPRSEPLSRAGAVSWATRPEGSAHPRGVVFSAGPRGELGLRFADLLALPRPGGALALYVANPAGPERDARDVTAERPIARSFAEAALSQYQSGAAFESTLPRASQGADGEPDTTDSQLVRGPLRSYEPSTRVVPDAVAASLRASGSLRR